MTSEKEGPTLNLSNIRPALRLMGYIERVRPGLGLVFVIVLAMRLGARWSGLGRGVFLVSGKGQGKGDTLEGGSIPQLGFLVEAGEDLHPSYIKKCLEDGKTSGLKIERLAVLFEDLAELHDDTKKLKRTLGMGSRQISQLSSSFTGYLDKPNEPVYSFLSVSWACGMTPDVLEKIRKLAAWRSRWSDRFSRLALIRTRRDVKAIKEYKLGGSEVSKVEIRERVSKLLPAKVPEQVRIGIDPDEIEIAARMLWGSWVDDPRTRKGARVGDVQHTETRRLDYLRGDLRGMAVLNGRDVAGPDDLALIELAAPLFRLASLEPYSAWITILSFKYPSIEDIVEETELDAFAILDTVRELQRFGLVFPIIPDATKPWLGSLEPGWYWEDWLEDLEQLKKKALEVETGWPV